MTATTRHKSVGLDLQWQGQGQGLKFGPSLRTRIKGLTSLRTWWNISGSSRNGLYWYFVAQVTCTITNSFTGIPLEVRRSDVKDRTLKCTSLVQYWIKTVCCRSKDHFYWTAPCTPLYPPGPKSEGGHCPPHPQVAPPMLAPAMVPTPGLNTTAQTNDNTHSLQQRVVGWHVGLPIRIGVAYGPVPTWTIASVRLSVPCI